MRASPAFQLEIQRHGAWRIAIGVVLLLAATAAAAWWLGDDGSRPRELALPMAVLAAATIAAGAGLMRQRPMSLHWDGQRWLLAPAAMNGVEPAPGNLAIALDLGSWMLLKFEHDSTTNRRRVSWLPVQRRGLEMHWHALRCAVYCARSAPGHDAGPNSASSPESQE
jgi:hypothetical protein